MSPIIRLFALLCLYFTLISGVFAQEEITIFDQKYGLSSSIIRVNHEFGVRDVYELDICPDDFDCYTTGLELALMKQLQNGFATLFVPFRFGIVDYLSRGESDRETMYGLGGNLQFGLPRKEKQRIFDPFVWTGLNIELSDERRGYLYVPLGAGLRLKMAEGIAFQAKGSLNLTNDRVLNHHSIELGLVTFLDNAKNKAPKEFDVYIEEEIDNNIKDQLKSDVDADGVPDAEDDCPNDAGMAIFNGCPDSDNDGVMDKDDDCPNESGPIANDGCPKDLSTMSDADGDGVTDNNDNCPDLAGPASNMGCPLPDQDQDGIADAEDKCPGSPGLARFGGCPDTDADGVPDNLDTCPDRAGLARFSGCPDTDGDGISDIADDCPNLAGTSANRGCPETSGSSGSGGTVGGSSGSSGSGSYGVALTRAEEETLATATRTVEFETAKAALRKNSYDVMDQVAAIMKKYPQYRLTIGGHTDSVGSSSDNQRLSESRAKSCKQYLINRGISGSRITAIGYGEKQPIADNRYSAGRKKNRRVEFRLSY